MYMNMDNQVVQASLVRLYKVTIDETRKCAATIEEDGGPLTITDAYLKKVLKPTIGEPTIGEHMKSPIPSKKIFSNQGLLRRSNVKNQIQ